MFPVTLPYGELVPHFQPKVRQEGMTLSRKNKVELWDGGLDFAQGTVTDREFVYAEWFLEEGVLQGGCSCADGGKKGCRHLWALLLEAANEGHLGAIPEFKPRAVHFHFAEEPEEDYPDDSDWDDEGIEVDEDDEFEEAFAFQPIERGRRADPRAGRSAGWQETIAWIDFQQREQPAFGERQVTVKEREILYCIDMAATNRNHHLTLLLAQREKKKDGTWGQIKAFRPSRSEIDTLPALDRRLLGLVVGADRVETWNYSFRETSQSFVADRQVQERLIPLAARAGRLYLRSNPTSPSYHPVPWKGGPAWKLRLNLVLGDSGANYVLSGRLMRGEEVLPLSQAILMTPNLLFTSEWGSAFAQPELFPWTLRLKTSGPITIPKGRIRQALGAILQMPHPPEIDLPQELRFEEVRMEPAPVLRITSGNTRTEGLRGALAFRYGESRIEEADPSGGMYDAQNHRYVRRDFAAERMRRDHLRDLDLPWIHTNRDAYWKIEPGKLSDLVGTLNPQGWQVEVDGKAFRKAGRFAVEIVSGIDWFDLRARIEFDGREVPLPGLLQALREGKDVVTLDDGSLGMLPQEWLRKYGFLADFGKAEGEHLRFRKHQAGLLDAFLAEQSEVCLDETFRRVRKELESFEGIRPEVPPPSFQGALRDYQQIGLGWLRFLRGFGFGGCLADDMGLGKTVQVLAWLAASAAEAGEGPRKPSLVVAPRSLIFNWKNEAARFVPHLKVLDQSGVDRARTPEDFGKYDLILTTYGTLRRDIHWLKDHPFDTCILDEAQAIKNADSESAKAVRLLQGDHRLALSGTPVENHLGELWSLFDFLNPGLLGSAAVFQRTGLARNPDPQSRTLLARALRPFLLRRTKEQVATELPAKTEQVLWCELDPAQRTLYDELRDHYRSSLLGAPGLDLKKAKIQVLEALLRLRQAACHPGLIDRKKAGQPSAKLDVLLPQLAEVIEENHKVLVFSQFTTLLGIVRERLEREGLAFEYLDGRTRDRQARVERFQNDPDCKLFLVSLKAGGVGLNLTAAEYVFLLDPWWNPAVEAQAIDRTHRIGQSRPVFAYRIIARDTVEEKVLELQKSKRDLAEAILSADNALLRDLQREDLELLLS